MDNPNEVVQDKENSDELIAAISEMSISEYSRLNEFITLTQQIKAKQDALDIMACDTTTAAIGNAYVADTLEPNSQGDLITLVAKTPGEQLIIDNIYKRLNIPLDKVVYSLFKNAISIAEFAHEGDVANSPTENLESIKQVAAMEGTEKSATEGTEKSATEGTEKSANEDILVKVNKSPIIPKIKLISDTTRVFPILHYEDVVGYIEVTMDDFSSFDFANDIISYKDVVIHSAQDYTYVKFGYRTETRPLQLRVKMEDNSIVEYDIDQGKSLLENAYPAWQTLSIMRDAINLARLAFSAQAVVVQTEVGNMTEAQIELARNKLKDLFENRLAFGKNGAKSYLQPQVKPNYIYSFTNNGKGAITTNTIGGDYNPGVLSDLKYFEDEYFGGMNAVKQHFARTSDSAGLDGGGAVEQYEKRYRSTVAVFKRALGQFIKNCINRVLLSRNLTGLYDNFEVVVNQAYKEEDMQVTNHQSTKLSFLQTAIEFMEIKDPNKVRELKLQALRSVITDKSLIQAFSDAVLESPKEEPDENKDGEGEGDLGGGEGPGGDEGVMGDIQSSFDEGVSEEIPSENPEETESEIGETTETQTEETGELPPVSEIVPESQIEEG